MNQGRIWCVVSPNVGLPLLLGSVAVTSLIVHASVMTHTTWMSNYWQGAKAKVAMQGATAPVASATPGSAFAMTVTPVPATGGAQQSSFVITVTPNATTPPTVAVANVEPGAGDHAAVAPPDHPATVN